MNEKLQFSWVSVDKTTGEVVFKRLYGKPTDYIKIPIEGKVVSAKSERIDKDVLLCLP